MNIPVSRERRNGNCMIAKTEHFFAVLKDAKADIGAKAQTLKFVMHIAGGLRQPAVSDATVPGPSSLGSLSPQPFSVLFRIIGYREVG